MKFKIVYWADLLMQLQVAITRFNFSDNIPNHRTRCNAINIARVDIGRTLSGWIRARFIVWLFYDNFGSYISYKYDTHYVHIIVVERESSWKALKLSLSE